MNSPAPKKYVAQVYVASRPDEEVLGQMTLPNIQNINRDEIEPLIKKHGLEDLRPDRLYRLQTILDFYRDIAEGKSNVTENLVAIGMKGAEVGPLPPEINSLDAWLNMLPFFVPTVQRNIAEGEGIQV